MNVIKVYYKWHEWTTPNHPKKQHGEDQCHTQKELHA